MAEFRADIKEVRDNVNKILGRLGSDTVAGTSPLRLTEKGQRISARLNAAALAKEIAPRLEARVAGKQPYEIQEICFEYARREYVPSPEVQALIMQCAFDNGIDRDQVLDVLAIELRDLLLPPPTK